jgi:hypothetical protein
MNLGIAEFRLSNADFGIDRKLKIGNWAGSGRGPTSEMDVSWGHEPDGFGVPALAGRALIAWGAGEYLQRRGFPSDSLNVQPFPG